MENNMMSLGQEQQVDLEECIDEWADVFEGMKNRELFYVKFDGEHVLLYREGDNVRPAARVDSFTEAKELVACYDVERGAFVMEACDD